MKIIKHTKLFLFVLALVLSSCSNRKDEITITSGRLHLKINNKLYTQVLSDYSPDKKITDSFTPSEYIIADSGKITDFSLISQKEENDKKGKRVWTITGKSKNNILKTLIVTLYDDFPDFIFTKVNYTNLSKRKIKIKKWVNNDYVIPQKDSSEIIWSYQGATYEDRPDWVLQVKNGFNRKNYMGMNATDYGGGVPIVDIWNKDFGFSIGHVEKVPKLVSLHVIRNPKLGGTEVKIEYEKKISLAFGKSLSTFTTFISTHKKDYFHTLKMFGKFMREYRGFRFNKPPEDAYEPIWCAWGYERGFTVKKVLGTLPEVKKLGYKWVVLDDGWQTAEGDWYLNPKKFPHGEKDMKKFVEKIHQKGLKAKLWWAPLAVDPGTDLIKKHPEMLLLNKEQKPEDISWWDSYYLCPAYGETLDYTKKLVRKFLQDWKFDGLKIDGQHLNGAPPCYNKAHHHKKPEESTEAMPNFFRTIYDEAVKINPNAVIEVCPCGTGYNFYMLPYLNQVVASDPVSSWQIRLKGKTFKALISPDAPYYGDHVELSDNKDDFASTIGIGGIIGTKFTWPVGIYLNNESGDVSLTKAKEKEWKKWIDIYNKYQLPKGKYLGELYDIGFDKPETHVIEKNGNLFYAFYAKNFSGDVELRGLDKNSGYILYDYVNNKKLKDLKKGEHRIKIDFKNYLLIEAVKKK